MDSEIFLLLYVRHCRKRLTCYCTESVFVLRVGLSNFSDSLLKYIRTSLYGHLYVFR